MATSTLQKKTDELEAIKKMKAYQAKLKTAKSEKAKAALQSKIKEINDTLKKGTSFKDLTAKQVANAKLASRKKFLEMSKKDFNAVIRTLAKKSEYAFLKNMSRPEIERDIKRKAKPVGWRFKGRGDYRTPTAAQARKGRANGTVYYENRPNRSDVSQSKQLAKGGNIESWVGEKESKGYPVYVRKSGYPTQTISFHKSKELAEKKADKLGGKTYAKGGKLKDKGLENFLRDADKITLKNGKVVSKAEFLKMRSKKMAQGGGVENISLKGKVIESVLKKNSIGGNEMLSIQFTDGTVLGCWAKEDGKLRATLFENSADWHDLVKDKRYQDGGSLSMADIKAMRDAEYDYDPRIDDSDLDDDKIVRYYFEEEPQYAEQGGGIKGAAKRGAKKAKKAGDDVADWAFNFDPNKKYNDGGEVNINDLDLPVHYTMFEDEMYEYGQGGKMKK